MSSSTSPMIEAPLRPEEVLAEMTPDGKGVILLRRVIWVSPVQRKLVLFDLLPDVQLRKPYWADLDDVEVRLRAAEYVRAKFSLPDFMLIRDDQYQNDPKLKARLSKHLTVRDRGWKVIAGLIAPHLEPAIYVPAVRGPLIADAAHEHGLTEKAVLRLLYRAYKYGRIPNALLPKWPNCGARGIHRKPGTAKRGRPSKLVTTGHAPEKTGVNVDEEMRRIILRGIDLYCGLDNRVPLSKAYEKTKERFFVQVKESCDGAYEKVPLPANTVPTFAQFYYYAKTRLQQMEFVRRRIGDNAYSLTTRGLAGTARAHILGPGHTYEIDSTVADVYLISRYNPEWIIGRPIIYVVIDNFSRLIVGLYVGLLGPSWEAASQALFNACSNKVEFCAANGYTITEAQWPAHHIPHTITADRGELVSQAAEAALKNLNVSLGVPPPYRPDWKAVVERRFRILNDACIDWIPGAVRQRQSEMRKRSYLEDATLDIEGFTRVILACVLEHNLYTRREDLLTREMITDGVEPYSVNMWHWGVANLTGPLRAEEPDLVRTHLLPSDRAKVTAHGISYKGLTYSCPRAVAEKWFDKARRFGAWPVDIRREYTTDRIHLAPPSVPRYEECQLLERDERFANSRLEEAIDCMEYLRLQGADVSDRDERGRFGLRSFAGSVIDKARQRKRQSRGAHSRQKQEIKRQRDQEATIERTLRSRRSSEAPSGATPLRRDAQTPSQLQVSPNMVDLLKQQRRNKWGDTE